jgi:hypothetical protein
MTPADRLIVGNTDMSLDDSNRVMQDARKGMSGWVTMAAGLMRMVGKLPIVNDQLELIALISRAGKPALYCSLITLCHRSSYHQI